MKMSPASVLDDVCAPAPKALRPPPSAATASSTASESSSSDEEAAEDGAAVADGPDDDDGALLRDYLGASRVDRMNRRAEEENGALNLNLGLPVDLAAYARRRDDAATLMQRALRPPVRILVRLLDRLLSLVESPLFRVWSERIPLRLRQRITFLAWGMYLPIHKALIGRRTGLHKDVSLEYHALTSVMWWGRLFPMTVKRMRMSLSQLHVWHPPERYPQWSLAKDATFHKSSNGERYGIRGHVYEVHHQMEQKRTRTGFRSSTTKATNEEMTVTGKYIQQASRPSRKVIFWIYGGAFLSGDSTGNMGIAEKMGMLCAGEDGEGMRDAFIPDHRLVPENHLDDALHDIALAYEYLIYERDVRPEDVTFVGVSSGGGLAILLFQALAKAQRECEERKGLDGRYRDGSSGCVPMPAGGVMMGPFVDYTEPKGTMKPRFFFKIIAALEDLLDFLSPATLISHQGTMREYIKHDLIVNQVSLISWSLVCAGPSPNILLSFVDSLFMMWASRTWKRF